MNERIWINPSNVEYAEELLDSEGFDYDWDTGGRLMCYTNDLDDITSLLCENDIDFDVI